MVLTRSYFTKRGSMSVGHKIHLKNPMGGAILLQKGGPGSGSSYSSLDEKMETMGGMGFKGLANLRNLEMRPPMLGISKPKNIAF